MEQKLQHIVRVVATDLDGTKPTKHALLKIKGISHSLSNAVCSSLKIDSKKQLGTLKKEEIERIEKAIRNPTDHKIPNWMLNRKKDYSTGEDKHLTNIDLKLQKDFDIKRLRKIKSYKGFRHGSNLPVRGQRTRSHFRKGKSLGVKKVKRGKKG